MSLHWFESTTHSKTGCTLCRHEYLYRTPQAADSGSLFCLMLIWPQCHFWPVCSKPWPAPSWRLCSVSSPAPVRPAASASAWSFTAAASVCSRFVPQEIGTELCLITVYKDGCHLSSASLSLPGGGPASDLYVDHGGAAGVQPQREPECTDVVGLPAVPSSGQPGPQLELPAAQSYPFICQRLTVTSVNKKIFQVSLLLSNQTILRLILDWSTEAQSCQY